MLTLPGEYLKQEVHTHIIDIIGWLESKIENVPVQQITRNKYLASKKNRLPVDTF